MPRLNQKGFVAQFLILLLLGAGLAVGLYLVQQKTNIFSKAVVSGPIGPETSFTLIGPNGCAEGWKCIMQFIRSPQKEEEFTVKLFVRSDLETANLFTAKMSFPKDLVEVKQVKTNDSFIKNWMENYFDNNKGTIFLTGGVPAPGYQTQVGGESALMAIIVFRAKSIGKGSVTFADSSVIYSNLNSINILTIKRPYNISVEAKPISAPVPKPTCLPRPTCLDAEPRCMIPEPVGGYCPTSSPKPICIPRPACLDAKPMICTIAEPAGGWCPTPPTKSSGDVNSDGKIDLVDMSRLLAQFGKSGQSEADINGDGKVNVLDVLLFRDILVKNGVLSTGR